MATASSPSARVARRRAAVREEALDHAVDLRTEDGVGVLTVSDEGRFSRLTDAAIEVLLSTYRA